MQIHTPSFLGSFDSIGRDGSCSRRVVLGIETHGPQSEHREEFVSTLESNVEISFY